MLIIVGNIIAAKQTNLQTYKFEFPKDPGNGRAFKKFLKHLRPLFKIYILLTIKCLKGSEEELLGVFIYLEYIIYHNMSSCRTRLKWPILPVFCELLMAMEKQTKL